MFAILNQKSTFPQKAFFFSNKRLFLILIISFKIKHRGKYVKAKSEVLIIKISVRMMIKFRCQ